MTRSWGVGTASIAVAALVLAFTSVGCGLLPWPSPAPTPTPTRTAPSPTPSPAPATPVPTSMPTAPPRADLTQEDAQATVRAWFEGLGAGDYGRMESLTTGAATEETRGLALAVQAGAAEKGVTAQLVVKRLDLAPGVNPPRGQAVQASFEIDVNALIGPASFTVRQVKGSASFVVERVDGQPRITDIRDPVGLPTPAP